MNIVLITSMVYSCNKPFTYCAKRSVFTRIERYQQLQKTIESIREKIPHAFIFLVECGSFSHEEDMYLKDNCDHVLNLVEDKQVVEDTSSIYKGLGERIQTLKAVEYIFSHYKDVDNLFKITGRYFYNDTFDLEQYNNDNMNFYKIKNDCNNINTCGYKLKNIFIKPFLDYLRSTRQEVIDVFKGSYEQYISKFVNQNLENVTFLPKLGISGYVSVCGSMYIN
jgi:hypothetical protein